jgi:hypothetical protein
LAFFRSPHVGMASQFVDQPTVALALAQFGGR